MATSDQIAYGPSSVKTGGYIVISMLFLCFGAVMADGGLNHGQALGLSDLASKGNDTVQMGVFGLFCLVFFGGTGALYAARLAKPFPTLTLSEDGLTLKCLLGPARFTPWGNIRSADTSRQKNRPFIRTKIIQIGLIQPLETPSQTGLLVRVLINLNAYYTKEAMFISAMAVSTPLQDIADEIERRIERPPEHPAD